MSSNQMQKVFLSVFLPPKIRFEKKNCSAGSETESAAENKFGFEFEFDTDVGKFLEVPKLFPSHCVTKSVSNLEKNNGLD